MTTPLPCPRRAPPRATMREPGANSPAPVAAPADYAGTATAGAAAIAARIAKEAPLVASCSVFDDTLMYLSVVTGLAWVSSCWITLIEVPAFARVVANVLRSPWILKVGTPAFLRSTSNGLLMFTYRLPVFGLTQTYSESPLFAS